MIRPGSSPTPAALAMWGTLMVFAAVALYAIVDSRPVPKSDGGLIRWYPVVHGVVFLAMFAVSWAVALPGLIHASNGATPEGTPVGSPIYVLACAAFCIGLIARSMCATGPVREDARPAIDGVHPGMTGTTH